jgi:hypothetical protein
LFFALQLKTMISGGGTMRVFSRISCVVLVLSVFLLCASGYAVTQFSAQGTVTKVTDSAVFLDNSGETAFFVCAPSVLKGTARTNLSTLVGKSVLITYHVMAGRNAIDILDVSE